MLEITIDPALAKRVPKLSLGWLLARVSGGEPNAELGPALAAAAGRTVGRPAAEVAAIASTRRAYKACGKDPSRYRPAAEALWRRTAKGEPVPRINAVVDANNLISLETGVSCGVYDLAQLIPPLLLRLGEQDEEYVGIGRGPLNIAGLPVLADASGAFGSPTSDSQRAMVRPMTRDLLFVAYGLGCPVDAALALAADVLARYAGACDIELQQPTAPSA